MNWPTSWVTWKRQITGNFHVHILTSLSESLLFHYCSPPEMCVCMCVRDNANILWSTERIIMKHRLIKPFSSALKPSAINTVLSYFIWTQSNGKLTFWNWTPYFFRIEGEIKVILWLRKTSQFRAFPGKKPAESPVRLVNRAFRWQ